MIEAKLLNRNAIGVDINPNSIKLSNQNLNFEFHNGCKIFTKLGNAKKSVFAEFLLLRFEIFCRILKHIRSNVRFLKTKTERK